MFEIFLTTSRIYQPIVRTLRVGFFRIILLHIVNERTYSNYLDIVFKLNVSEMTVLVGYFPLFNLGNY